MKEKNIKKNRIRLPVIEMEKYKGKQVAIFRGRIIADGKNLEETM